MVDLELRKQLPEDALVFDNFAYDNSIIGVSTSGRVVYSYEKMVQELMEEEGWSEEDARDWIDFNTIRSLSYAGENKPIIVEEIMR